MTTRIGVVGIGRLGTALVKVLKHNRQAVIAWDCNPQARSKATESGTTVATSLAHLAAACDLALLCTPGPQTEVLTHSLEAVQPGLKIISLTTQSGSAKASHSQARPMGQFAAISAGLPWRLLTSDEDTARVLQAVLPNNVQVVVDKQTDVQTINRLLTRIALQACAEAEQHLAAFGIREPSLGSGVKSVLVGTVLDYPPEPSNEYTAPLLAELGLS